MIKTVKSNTDMILKIMINQVGIDIFGLTLFMASSAAGQGNNGSDTGHIMKIVTSIFSIGFYLVLLYTLSKNEGLADQIRIEGGRIKRDNFRFLKVSLIANAINILLGVVIVILNLVSTGMGDAFPALLENILGGALVLVTLTEGMYIGLLTELFSNYSIAYVLIALPAVIVCTVGYIAGTYGGFRKWIAKGEKSR